MDRVYFDYNATTPCDLQIWKKMQDVACVSHNSSSVHQLGRQANAIVENARRAILESINAKNMRLIFTSGGTEANNLAIKGFVHDYKILVSCVEHASIFNQDGVEYIAVDKNGVVNLDLLDAKLLDIKGKVLVSVMHANNETGVIQPIAKISEICKKHDAILHSDASQSLGKINVDFKELGLDMMTISSHKIYGPQGVAALVLKKKLEPKTIISGGGQEYSYRSGTLNVANIYGFSLACQKISSLIEVNKNIENLRNFLDNAIMINFKNYKIIANNAERLPNTTCIAMNGVDVHTQLIHFDMNGFCVSSGAACSSGKVEQSHVLQAMGESQEVINSTIRISLGKDNFKEQLEKFVDCWGEIYKRVNNKTNKVA